MPELEEKSHNPQAEADHLQWLSDVALMERYPNEPRIEEDRNADLGPVRQLLADNNRRLQAALDQRKGELQNELDFYPHGGIPLDLAERLKSNSQAQEVAKRGIAHGEADEKRINDKYDDYLKRFRDLKRKQKKL
jgi:hypothetical protein